MVLVDLSDPCRPSSGQQCWLWRELTGPRERHVILETAQSRARNLASTSSVDIESVPRYLI